MQGATNAAPARLVGQSGLRATVSDVIAPPGFEWIRDGRTTFLVRSDVRSWIVPLLRAATSDQSSHVSGELVGGRGGARIVRGNGHAVVVRPYRRGGVPAWVLRDTYFGRRPRPFRELFLSEMLRLQGVPVAEVYGASVRWLAPGCYRGWLVTRYVHGARTFWEWAQTPVSTEERAAVLRRIGAATRQLHDSGVRHPDLNLNNILVCRRAEAPHGCEVCFIDFDRARHGARLWWRPTADLARLRRSARKLDPAGRYVTAADLDRIEAEYRDARP